MPYFLGMLFCIFASHRGYSGEWVIGVCVVWVGKCSIPGFFRTLPGSFRLWLVIRVLSVVPLWLSADGCAAVASRFSFAMKLGPHGSFIP